MFIAHGTMDTVLPYSFGDITRQKLESFMDRGTVQFVGIPNIGDERLCGDAVAVTVAHASSRERGVSFGSGDARARVGERELAKEAGAAVRGTVAVPHICSAVDSQARCSDEASSCLSPDDGDELVSRFAPCPRTAESTARVPESMSLSAVRGAISRLTSRASTSVVGHRRSAVVPRAFYTRRRSAAPGCGAVLTVLASRAHCAMATSSPSYPKPIVVPPPEGGETKAVCIFLHGLGDTGHGWADVAGQMPFEGVKWIFPTAPTIPITLNGGMRMTGWYDINDLSIEGIIDDREQTLASAAYVASLVDEAIAEGVPSERILIGGFSQGGVIALTGCAARKLAGCAALSTYLALRDDYPDALSAHAKSLPIFLAHGTADQVLRYEYGEMTAAKLTDMDRKRGLQDIPRDGAQRVHGGAAASRPVHRLLRWRRVSARRSSTNARVAVHCTLCEDRRRGTPEFFWGASNRARKIAGIGLSSCIDDDGETPRETQSNTTYPTFPSFRMRARCARWSP